MLKTSRLIAADCDLRPEAVGRCLMAVLNGAAAHGGRSSAISRILASGKGGWGREQGRRRAERLLKDRDFLSLLRDIHYARGVIAHQWPRTPDGQLINDAGAAIDESASKFQKLAHILGGAQAVTLRTVADELGPKIEMTPSGWSAPVRLDMRRLRKRIRERTGYRVSLAVKR
jgi:hypothetical protein